MSSQWCWVAVVVEDGGGGRHAKVGRFVLFLFFTAIFLYNDWKIQVILKFQWSVNYRKLLIPKTVLLGENEKRKL